MVKKIQKENGRWEDYSVEKAADSIYRSMQDCENLKANKSTATKLAKQIDSNFDTEKITTNDWAEEAIRVLRRYNKELCNHYRDIRVQKQINRLKNSNLMKSFKDVLYSEDDDPNSIKQENANIDGKNSAAQLHRIASETNKEYVLDYLLPKQYAKAHKDKYIHIHDLDYFELNQNCLQTDLKFALENGYNTGNTKNNEPKSIMTAAMLSCIVMQAAQNGQHGGISIGNFDYALAKYVDISYRKHFKSLMENYLELTGEEKPEWYTDEFVDSLYYTEKE